MTPLSELRRRILKTLYGFHKGEGHGSMMVRDLMDMVAPEDETEFFESLQYLHDEEYVEGTFVPYERQGYFESARITPKGVDLVDTPAELDRVLPVDREHREAESFLEDFIQEIRNADIPEGQKEVLLMKFGDLLSHPALPGIAAKALRRFRRAG